MNNAKSAKINWSSVNWKMSGRAIATSLGVTDSAVSRARQRYGQKHPAKRGPIKGEGGRHKGPDKCTLWVRVRVETADYLRAKYPESKTLAAAAAQALDSLSDSNA